MSKGNDCMKSVFVTRFGSSVVTGTDLNPITKISTMTFLLQGLQFQYFAKNISSTFSHYPFTSGTLQSA